ncbi:hypothetical protein BKA66DRAFT_572273 [Pyrenochaeta sp. MPI-SDFR-AT-0127]|nr:hypothetical protein BKA66DRAFT_572273 [Pyrenochaeta sp. MPI-SDFR-AT-0127]
MATSKVASCGLSTLPDELLLAILDYIEVDDIPTLRDLVSTNRRLHDLAIKRLYSRYSGHTPELFLRTIALPSPARCPALADNVKQVFWDQKHMSHQERLRGEEKVAFRRPIADQLSRRGFNLRGLDSKDLRWRYLYTPGLERNAWWYLEFFLCFVPNVETLVVSEAWQWDDHVYWFEILPANPGRFQRLTSITLHGPLRLENIVPVITLPSLQTLELTQVLHMRQEPGRTFLWDEEPVASVKSILAAGSSLEHFILRESHIDTSSLLPFFQAFRALKSFTYEHCFDYLSTVAHLKLDYQALTQCLRLQRASLEYLRVRHSFSLSEMDVDLLLAPHTFLTARPELRSNLPLSSLRTLDLGPFDIQYPYGTGYDEEPFVEALPRSLEVLRIHWKYDFTWPDRLPKFLAFMGSVAARAASALPRLKHVALVDWPALAGWVQLPSQVAALHRLYATMDIRFSVVYEHIHGPEPLEVREHVEPEWLWVQKTGVFPQYEQS